jgi:hypothetical protein
MIVGSILLGTMILAAFVLVMLLVLGPSNGVMTVAMGQPQAEPCPTDSGGTACYRFEATNTGQAEGVATCSTTAAPGTDAVFANGADVVGVRLQAGEVKGVYVRVTPEPGSDTVSAPTLTCQV